MKKINKSYKFFLTAAAAFFLPLFLLAQDPMLFIYRPHWPQQSDPFHNSISFSGEYNAGSDALTNSFMNSFYQGAFLDSEMKSQQENLLLPSSRIGIYASMAMAYTWRADADTGKWEFTVALRDRQSVYGKFSNDAFRLAFEGNRAFLGTTADLDNTHLTQMHWQQMQFEAKYYSPDKRSDAAFGFSILNGQLLQEINIRKGSVFTESDGTAIDVTSSATYFRSDTSSTKYGTRNGSGSCFNFRFNTYLGDSDAHYHHQISFMVQDLGFIRWNNKSEIYAVDTTMHYTGVDASDILINGGHATNVPNSDSLIGKPQNGQVIAFLPLGVRFRYTLLTSGSWWGGIDARAWSYGDALPQVTMFAGWRTKDLHFNTTVGAAWGGYARLQFPVQIGWDACKHFSLIAGTTNLAGYILPKKTHGQGLFMNLSFAF
jgi:hypothetical protein